MNKKELVEVIAEKLEITKKDAGTTVDAVLEAIEAAVEHGEKVQLTGFGTFEAKVRKARMGKNLKTGEPVEIAAAVIPTFKAGKQFKERIDPTGSKANITIFQKR